VAILYGLLCFFDDVGLPNGPKIMTRYIFNPEENDPESRFGHFFYHRFILGHGYAVGLNDHFQVSILSQYDSITEAHDPFWIQNHIVIGDKDQPRFFVEVDVVKVGKYALNGICPVRASVHMTDAAKITVAGASSGCFHDLNPGIHEMVSARQASMIADRRFQVGQITELSPFVVNPLTILLIGER
jgi:hypothetical protein